MRPGLTFAAAVLAIGFGRAALADPVVDPDVRGPVRRGAAATAEGLGAPGVENRIERRETRRDLRRFATNPNAAQRTEERLRNDVPSRVADSWRFRWHNNQWWYYTPQNSWMIYENNAWMPYSRETYVPRYRTGYRGYEGGDRHYYENRRPFRYRRGAPRTYYYVPPYSNGTRAGNFGANLGAEIGATANGAAGANTGAAIGGAIGSAVGAGEVAETPTGDIPPNAEGQPPGEPDFR